MRTLFAGSVVLTAFAVYACSSDPASDAPVEAPDAAQDAPVAPDVSYDVDASKDAPDVTDAPHEADTGCTRNAAADSNCSSQSRQAYLCPGDAGQPSCDFFAGFGDVSLYCCE